MIEGGGSRNWIETKSLMYRDPGAFRALLEKLIEVLVPYCQQQIDAGADAIQIFDSWVGSLSVPDYREFVLPLTTGFIRRVQALGVPVIYFGVDTASLLPAMRSTGADVLGLDWRVPLDAAWASSRSRMCGARQSRSHHAVRPSRSDSRSRAQHPLAGRGTARAHLQCRTRHRAGNSRRKRAGRRPIRSRICAQRSRTCRDEQRRAYRDSAAGPRHSRCAGRDPGVSAQRDQRSPVATISHRRDHASLQPHWQKPAHGHHPGTGASA